MTRTIRILAVAFLTGALSLGAAWAGVGLAPPAAQVVVVPEGPGLHAGAAKVSIHPDPPEDREWQTDAEACDTLGGAGSAQAPQHLTDLSSPWPRNPDCIYVGGYGIGPMNSVEAFDDEYGLWARSVAVTDGFGWVVLTVVDGVYWFGDYEAMCDGCGAFDLQQQLGDELGIDPASLVFAATHSHTAPDFIGGWGGVPDWYMEQAAEAMREAVREAVTSVRPATLEAGEVLARQHNRERRNTYRAAEEAGLSWFRAHDVDTGETIVTVGAYAGHPTTISVGDRIAHGDWPALFNARLEERFGGVGIHFMTGLGNMSIAGGTQAGVRLADLVPDIGEGLQIADAEVRAAQEFWDQPVTNTPLMALGGGGFFDRPFSGPAEVSVAKGSSPRACNSASAVSVNTAVSAARIGPLAITAGPGELFSNLTNVIKEQAAGQGVAVTFPLGNANDGLGYILQSFESYHEARQGLGFVGGNAIEYEDAYSIDHCFGDKVLETTLALLGGLQSTQ